VDIGGTRRPALVDVDTTDGHRPSVVDVVTRLGIGR
jgi:hypothetical protein